MALTAKEYLEDAMIEQLTKLREEVIRLREAIEKQQTPPSYPTYPVYPWWPPYYITWSSTSTMEKP